jgi:hypothetical protein
MGRSLIRWVWFPGLALGLSLAGCGRGDNLPRQALSGTVTLDGQPLALGVIQFQPSSPAEPLPAGAEIKDGKFRIPREDGPTPGNYRVFINSSGPKRELTKAESSGEKMPGLAPELIPEQYNTKSNLTAKVEADKDNTFEFALKSK